MLSYFYEVWDLMPEPSLVQNKILEMDNSPSILPLEQLAREAPHLCIL